MVAMTITENISCFFQDVHQTITLLNATADSQVIWGSGLSYAKNYSVAVLDITYRKAIAHYPKPILIALVVNSIAAILLPSLGSLFVLGVNCLFFYTYEKFLFKAIHDYDEANISEWIAPTEVKLRVILIIEGREFVQTVYQAARSFFSRFAFWR